MTISRRSMIFGTAAGGTAALALAACGGGSDSGSGSGGGSGDPVYAFNIEPQNPLIPTNTNEVGGGRVLNCIFAGLVYYKADGTAENDLAESIESDDNQTWTIKIKKGKKFSDGSEITAKSFVDAWNYGANAKNAQLGQSFFEPIEGFDKVSADGAKADDTLSGLEVVDDQTFTVKLVSEQSDFPNRLGYSAYVPLPESAFDDMKAFGEKPVSNGPYTVDSWTHDQEIVLVPNDGYDGPRKAKNSGLTFTIYSSDDTMYGDLESGDVDVVDIIPNSALTSFEDTLGDRAVNEPGALFQTFTIAQNDPNFSGEAGKLRRQAISRAIDRKSICDMRFVGCKFPDQGSNPGPAAV